uniref:RNA-dependent RNA polymerase n=1 Tax=Erysiphe necator associated polymycovirus 6 TaxID=2742560 RepID=A0A8E3YZD4_9VIRU|nr:RNA-dependent RNA polymerase [Erysiphe necator associated polymycovirus 6]
MSTQSERQYGNATTINAFSANTPTRGQVSTALGPLVSKLVSKCVRGGLFRNQRTFGFSHPDGAATIEVTVERVAVNTKPFVAAAHARASAFFIGDGSEAEAIAYLRGYDEPKPAVKSRKTPFYRSTHRIEPALERASKMALPSIELSRYQLPKAFSFGGGPPVAERPLLPSVLGAVDRAASIVDDASYTDKINDAVTLGDYTSHDPDTLHPRFLEYVKERVLSVPERDAEVLAMSMEAQREMWSRNGIKVRPRDLCDAEPDNLGPMLNHGSSGEYRNLGVKDRKEKRLVELMSQSLMRYGRVGTDVAAGRPVPAWVHTTIQPTLAFGKEEPKAAKRDANGVRIPPVPRFIFNMSPINYALAAFLHSDLSKALQEHDPTHGPGFGPGRGRSGKFLDLVERCFKGRTTLPVGEEMVMSDIEKWDANMKEVLIDAAHTALEDHVDTSLMSVAGSATRAAMVSVARRQLKTKLLEHPSGYLLYLHGAMPSGSYYTSLINTNANNLLIISHLIDRLSAETSYTVAGAAEAAITAIPGLLVSYGDNQLFSAKIFSRFGLAYDPVKHAAHLAKYGMRLKIDETEVTRKIGRVRFCSRAVVHTPKGLLITRTHTSLVSKLAARPEHDAAIDKLYVRAMMADHMGTDPVVYQMLDDVDRQIDVPLDLSETSPRVKAVLEPVAKSMYGEATDDNVVKVLDALTRNHIDRHSLLSLHTPRTETITRRSMKLGSALSIGDMMGGVLTSAARWALEQTPSTWVAYLKETDQLGVLWD